MQNSFKRYFKNNNEYQDFKEVVFMDSLAYTVQEYLYTDKAKNEDENYNMSLRIKLYDFMNIVIPFIKASQSDFGIATIKGYIQDMKKKRRVLQSGESLKETEKGNLVVACASKELITAVLWSAFIYVKFCVILMEKFNGEKEQWVLAQNTLEGLMKDEISHREKQYEKNYLVKNYPDALMFFCKHWEKITQSLQEAKQTENEATQTVDDQQQQAIVDGQKVQIEQLKEENMKLVMENQKLTAELEAVKQNSVAPSPNTNSNEWIACFDGFLHSNLNPQAIAEALKNISHSNFPKNERGYWWTFVTVLTELNWIPKQNYKLVLQWANLHFNCGWDWNKDSQFKFSDINEKIKSTQPSSKWNRNVTGNVIGDYYGELAKTMKATFVEEFEGGKIIDRSEFIKSGSQRINQGR